MTDSTSLIPAAQQVVQEAKSSKVSISLLLFGFAIGIAYWAGRDSAKGVAEAQLEAMKTVQDERLGQLVDALKAQKEISQLGYQDVIGETRGVRREVQGLAAEVQVVKSHVSGNRER